MDKKSEAIDEITEDEIAEWIVSEEEELPKTANEKISIEEKYAKSQMSIVRSSMDLTLNTIKQAVFENSNINRVPDYQRRHRWDNKKRSQLIESILMNIPIPPVFLFETEYNSYEVMDGRQRLDTVISFLDGKFSLRGLEYWGELNGKNFNELPDVIRKGLLRRTISAIVLLAETARKVDLTDLNNQSGINDVRMVIFRRLNTGGVMLNPQELRNALYPSKFNKMLREAARGDFFTKIWGIPPVETDEETNPSNTLLKNTLYKSMADCELVLRVFAIREMIEGSLAGSLRSLLDRCMIKHKVDSDESVLNLRQEFDKNLEILYNLFDGKPFRLKEGRLSRPLYDALMVSLSLNPDPYINTRKNQIIEKTNAALGDSEKYEILIGRGNTVEAIKERVNLASYILTGK